MASTTNKLGSRILGRAWMSSPKAFSWHQSITSVKYVLNVSAVNDIKKDPLKQHLNNFVKWVKQFTLNLLKKPCQYLWGTRKGSHLSVFAGQKHDKLLPTLLQLDPGPTSWITVPQICMLNLHMHWFLLKSIILFLSSR